MMKYLKKKRNRKTNFKNKKKFKFVQVQKDNKDAQKGKVLKYDKKTGDYSKIHQDDGRQMILKRSKDTQAPRY